jgi:hypothetical protein
MFLPPRARMAQYSDTSEMAMGCRSVSRAIASALHFVVAGRGAIVIHEELRIDGAVHASLSRLFTRHS